MNFSSFSLKVLAASLVLASTTGFAANYKGDYKGEAPCPMPPSLMDGFYVGGQIGYDSFRVGQSDTDVEPGLFAINTNGTSAATGWMGGLFLGYGQYFSNFYYLAGEIFANWSGAEQRENIGGTFLGIPFSGSQKFEANGTFGLSLLPGIKLNDATLGYLRLGYDWTRLKATDTESVTLGGVTTTASQSNSNTRGGWDLGLGMETLLVQNWSARVEYNHIWYTNFSALGANFRPSDNQYTLGILYHFG